MSKPFLHHPTTPEELRELVRDPSVDLRTIDISQVNDLSRLFVTDYNNDDDCFVATDRYDFTGIASWDVSHVTNMEAMFAGCRYFDEDLRSWDVRKVTNMRSMFEGCTFLDRPFKWNTESLVDATRMFKDCYALESRIELNMSRAKTYKDMFLGATHLRANPELINFVAPRYHGEFPHRHYNSPEVSIYFLKEIRATTPDATVANAESTTATQYQPHSVQEARLLLSDAQVQPRDLDLSLLSSLRGLCATDSLSFPLNKKQYVAAVYPELNPHLPLPLTLDISSKNLDELDCRNATDLSYFFAGQRDFNRPLDLQLKSKINSLAYMFSGCTSFNQPLDFLERVKELRIANGMFVNCTSFNQPVTFSQSKLESATKLLSHCTNFNNKVTISSKSLSNVSWMFKKCTTFNHTFIFNSTIISNATGLLYGCSNFNQPVRFRAEQLQIADEMFAECKVFNQAVNLATLNLESCKGMFRNCVSFNSRVQLIQTQARNHEEMFAGCSALQLPVAFTDKAQQLLLKRINLVFPQYTTHNMQRMFANCTQLQECTFNSDLHAGTVDAQKMFAGCAQLEIDRANLERLLPMHEKTATHSYTTIMTKKEVADRYQGLFENCYKLLFALTPRLTPVVPLQFLFAGTQPLELASAQQMAQDVLWDSKINKYCPRNVQQLRLLLSVPTISCAKLQCSQLDSLQGAWCVSGVFAYNDEKFYNEYLPLIKTPDQQLLLNPEQWDGFTEIFRDAQGEVKFPIGITNLDYCFSGQKNFNQSLDDWDFTQVESTRRMLANCTSFNQNIANLKLPKVQVTERMFYNCTSFNQKVNLQLESATSCQWMFAGCSQLNRYIILILPQATNLTGMFLRCSSLNNQVYLKAPRAQYLNCLFSGCSSFNQPFTLPSAEILDMREMFKGCSQLNQSFTWVLPKVQRFDGLFQDCTSLNSRIDITCPQATYFTKMMAGTTKFSESFNLTMEENPNVRDFLKFWKGNKSLPWYKRVKFLFCMNFMQRNKLRL